MSLPSLHILAPGLLDRTRQWAGDYGSLPRFGGTEALLARSDLQVVPARGVDATLCALFGLTAPAERDLPLGAVRRYGFNPNPGGPVWLCADPVYLRADVTDVFLHDGGSLAITPDEASQLADLFAGHFADKGLALEIATPQQWHLSVPVQPCIKTRPLRLVMGKAIEGCLPTGKQARAWCALLNEIQMLFHGAEINRCRASRGEPLINGLWLSGAGVLPAAASLRAPVATLWSNDPLAVGLGWLAGVEVKPPAPSLDIILAGALPGPHLVCLDSMLSSASYDDFAGWRDALVALENAWFAPVLRATARGELGSCDLYDCAGRQFRLDRPRRWRFWRRAQRLDGAFT